MDYVIIPLENNKQLVICLSHIDIALLVKPIEDDLKNSNTQEIIIDKFLFTGNTNNRFLSCRLYKDKLVLGPMKNIRGETSIKQKTSEWLYQHFKYVEQTNLSEELKQKIKNYATKKLL